MGDEMAHFRHHIGGGTLAHGMTTGISQVGIGPGGQRVYIDPRRGRGQITEVRARDPDIPIRKLAAATGKELVNRKKFNGGFEGGMTSNLDVPQWVKNLGQDAIEKWIRQQLGLDTKPGAGALLNCGEGTIQVGDKCVDLGAAGPGGDPFITDAGGVAVEGSFGIPAFTPTLESRTVRSCGPRMVLGFDNLCYPKAVLPRRSKFRKWRGEVRPIISRRDTVALRRAGAARDRLADAAKDAGLFVSKSPRRKALAPKSGGTLQVVHEAHN